MRLISYTDKKKVSLGKMISDSSFISITEFLGISSTINLIKDFSKYKNRIDSLAIEEKIIKKIENYNILSPIPNPKSLRDAYSFKQHVETSRKNRGLDMIKEFDDFPVYYYSNHNAIKGAGEIQIQKDLSDMLDY